MEKRSECPISFSLDLLGDRWTLLVVRDLALKGKRTFSELAASDEGIATNILSDRLNRLEAEQVIEKQRDPNDGRRFIYRVTDRGKDLLPVLVELIVWGTNNDPDSTAPQSFIRSARNDRKALLKRLRSNLDET